MMNPYAQSLKVWVAGGITGTLGLAVLVWVAGVGPELSHVSATKTATSDAQLHNLVLMSKVNRLRSDNDKLASLTAELGAVRDELPTDSGMPSYIRQVLSQAATAGVGVTSISAGAPSIVVNAASPAAAAGTGPAGHLFQIPISLATTGSLAQERKLLHDIQAVGPRRALVSIVQFAPAAASQAKTTDSIDAHTTMTATMQVFVAPQNPAAEAELKKEVGR